MTGTYLPLPSDNPHNTYSFYFIFIVNYNEHINILVLDWGNKVYHCSITSDKNQRGIKYFKRRPGCERLETKS